MGNTWGRTLADTYRGYLSSENVRRFEDAPDYLCGRIDRATAGKMTELPDTHDDTHVGRVAGQIADERDEAIEALGECRRALADLRFLAERLAKEARDARTERDDVRDRLADARVAWEAVAEEVAQMTKRAEYGLIHVSEVRAVITNHEPDWSGATPPGERT